ncbi:hypothetical protein [Acidihalobacter ferrooxydans]|uniref:CN hydrolase domain-containing protein n=1 Tax=Acidihalobacter ferrooxydans TaxID=1765967 RepID=A0A1P8UFN5_9GAMM|nr:hypothetical protein [Acidihalobacter ferrooxydans]APZ42601.1 hypothetical protein BW247_05395 [Acidihalobacter ferrooxydans]
MLRITVIAFLSGIAIGALAWHPPNVFAVLWLLPVLWPMFSRRGRLALAVGYFASALSSVPLAVMDFYTHQAWVLAPVLAIGAVLVSGGALMLAAMVRTHTGLAWALAVLACAVPPLGAFGMASPLFAATAAFPGWGLAGLGLTFVLMMGLASRSLGRPLSAAALAVLAPLAWAGYHPAPSPAHWVGMNTASGHSPHTAMAWVDRQVALRNQVLRKLSTLPSGSVLLTPEMIGGQWNGLAAIAWAPVAQAARTRGVTVLLGDTLVTPHGKLDGFLALGRHTGVLSARQPIPVTEWLHGYPAHWWRFGPAHVGHTPVSLIVCYEQLLVWPVAWSFMTAHPPTLILAPSNHGWAKPGLDENKTQNNAARAWARLYGRPLVVANNVHLHDSRHVTQSTSLK